MATGTGTTADPRTYDIATETASGAAWTDLLITEIEAASLSSVLVDVGTDGGSVNQGVTTGGTLALSFDSALSGADTTTLDALVLAHDASEIPSIGWKRWEQNAVQSTTSDTFVPAMTQVSPTLPKGMYRVDWTCEVRIVASGPLNSGGDLRFSVDGNNKGRHYHESEQWTRHTGWDFQRFQSGEKPVFLLEYQRVGGNDTVEIRRCKIAIEAMDS